MKRKYSLIVGTRVHGAVLGTLDEERLFDRPAADLELALAVLRETACWSGRLRVLAALARVHGAVGMF